MSSPASCLPAADQPGRPEIALSWRRAELDGINPGAAAAPTITDTDRSSRLMVAAAPVLRDLEARLDGQQFSLILADRECRVVYAWSGCSRLLDVLNAHGVVLGAQLAESAAGTNGLGTALEIERGIAVNGEEHFLEVLKRFSCFGLPIRHPLTRRLEGVLDITSQGGAINPLSGPLLAGAVREIEARVVEGARDADRRLFLAFQNATRLRSTPVAVLGGDVVLANRACLDRLRSVDPAILGTLVTGGVRGDRMVRDLDLGAGERVRVLIEALNGTNGGALFRLGDVETVAAREPVPTMKQHGRRVHIAGEPGTGRSTRARRLVVGETPAVIDAADVVATSPDRWTTQLAGALAGTATIIENVDLLPARLSEILRTRLGSRGSGTVVITSCPAEELPPHAARIAARCPEHIELETLRERVHELPALVEALAAASTPRLEATFTARALAELADHPWHGNLTELNELVRDLAHHHVSPRIDAADLPARYRSSARTAGLGGREKAERVALLSALQSCCGNKLKAAAQLGISRTTLYRRMQALDIVG